MSAFLDGAETTVPHVFIQYKGTDICMDFHCDCDALCHFDGYFASVVKCPHCQQEWEMPPLLFPRKRCDLTYPHEAKIMRHDEDHEDENGKPIFTTDRRK